MTSETNTIVATAPSIDRVLDARRVLCLSRSCDFDDIKGALRRQLPVDDIVAVDRGSVTLMGKVPWYGLRQRAEQAARSTPGVNSVVNKILVGI